MLILKKLNPIFKLFYFFNRKRKIQILFLVILQVFNGIFEFFSIASIVPFLSIVVLKDDLNKIPIFGNFLSLFGLKDFSESSLIITLCFCLFVVISTFFRIFNSRYTYKLSANLEIDLSHKIFKDNIYQSYLDYTKKNSSDFTSIILDKVAATATALRSFFILTGSLILGLFIIGSLLFINWQIIFSSILGHIFSLSLLIELKHSYARCGKIGIILIKIFS